MLDVSSSRVLVRLPIDTHFSLADELGAILKLIFLVHTHRLPQEHIFSPVTIVVDYK